MSKVTKEFVISEYKKQGYIVISEYKKTTKTLFVKDEEGYICSTNWQLFKKGYNPRRFRKANPYTIQNIQHFIDLNIEGYKILSEKYEDRDKKLLFQCDKGHSFEVTWSNFQKGQRCPYCANKKVLKGFNDVATVAPWMIDLGMSIEDAKTHTVCSNDNISVTCPNCGKEKLSRVYSIYNNKSIQCSCNDKTSYGEKFVEDFLRQLEIDYIKEYKPSWSNNCRYDFYFEHNNKQYIIEVHGVQHYKQTGRKGERVRTLQEEQNNDKYKQKLALQNKINNYIILDCRNSNLKYIKNSIINSQLNEIFNLNNIDWLKCESFALSNRIKEVCNYWSNKSHKETINDIADRFKLSGATIRRYLKYGSELNWCDYNPEDGKNSQNKSVEILKDEISLGIFKSMRELERQSEELFGAKLKCEAISRVCSGKYKTHKGFTFKLVNDN